MSAENIFISNNIFSYAINPARDLGPRLMTWMFGWGTEVWSASNYWFWIPVIMCHVGGIIGAGLHLVLCEWSWCGHDPVNDEENTDDKNSDDKEKVTLKMNDV